MRFTLPPVAVLAVFGRYANGKACRPDVCGLVVQGQHGSTPDQIANHRDDCSSFLSVTVIPPTSTVYEVVSSIVATSSDTVSVLSWTETDTITVSSTLTSVSVEIDATTVESTDTSTTTTTLTATSIEVDVYPSTWTSSTTTTTSITGTSSATDVLTSVTSETVSSTITKTTTQTSTSTSTSIAHAVPGKRSAVVSDDTAMTISPSHIPDYATQACSASSLYSSACAAWGVLVQTTTELTPITIIKNTVSVTKVIDVDGHTTVTVDKSVTGTATALSVEVSLTTVIHVDSATETDTLTSSATVTSTSVVPVEVISTKILTKSTAITLTTTTTTTSTGTSTAIKTASRTISSTVPWCTEGATVQATGCGRSQWTLHCNQVIVPVGTASDNYVVFNAPQETLDQCIAICDSNGWCTSGQFNGETGQCLLYLYAGSQFESFTGTTGAVTSFEVIFGTIQVYDCPVYECPNPGGAQCCGGNGCADFQPPYGA